MDKIESEDGGHKLHSFYLYLVKYLKMEGTFRHFGLSGDEIKGITDG